MQRKAYVPGVAVLLAAVLAGCTGSPDDAGRADDSNPGSAGTATQAAQPGRYATLPEPCGVVEDRTLRELLPGIDELADETRRQKAYAGEATLTYDTDRTVGCRWKVESSEATDHLLIDLERIVSYDNAVSDDAQAEQLFAEKRTAAQLPEPKVTESGSPDTDASAEASSSPSGSPSASASGSPSGSASASDGTASPSAAPSDLQPRVLDDLGDEAFIDDELSSSGSTAKQRTVTVAFRTSNVIVTIEYAEQPMTVGVVPDSKEMQDRARKLASELADSLSD
ncbi:MULTISPECIES: DUF3558 domain-containing protein [Streptomyces]|uniref:DUF3558 domain-containing protein n=2 Tax=Streptomyces TaxID=1883 RepID=A0AA40SJC3_9ACTN|nr:DUF3558 domain-containing protein [Streptomyces calvus]MBA8947586.1 hypothetical protein [Streptomyces calvus]MBA8973956.1 hypothetical protein [Streptomyces calvus]MYS25832.1 DUF3558 domain-containing protein [Streptomyces sp. SID7804]GGP79736.1 hypothetical protein GCM10010247_61390 [Streptomyces calvus]